jgi:hypothetical protein
MPENNLCLREIAQRNQKQRNGEYGKINYVSDLRDRLCGLVVRVLGYRFGGPGFDSQALQDFPTKKKKENK